MPYGPYGTKDWPTGCDPYWSDLNGGCSDYAGDVIDTRTGESLNSLELTNFLRGVQNALAPAPKPATTAAAPPTDKKTNPAAKPPFDLQKWLETGYNLVYVALGFLALILVVGTAKGGRR